MAHPTPWCTAAAPSAATSSVTSGCSWTRCHSSSVASMWTPAARWGGVWLMMACVVVRVVLVKLYLSFIYLVCPIVSPFHYFLWIVCYSPPYSKLSHTQFSIFCFSYLNIQIPDKQSIFSTLIWSKNLCHVTIGRVTFLTFAPDTHETKLTWNPSRRTWPT